MLLLLDEVEANTTGSQDTFKWNPSLANSGKGMVYAFGTWDGATLTVEFSPDGGTTWFAIGTDTTFTASGWANFEMQGMVLIRGSISSVGTTTLSLGLL